MTKVSEWKLVSEAWLENLNGRCVTIDWEIGPMQLTLAGRCRVGDGLLEVFQEFHTGLWPTPAVESVPISEEERFEADPAVMIVIREGADDRATPVLDERGWLRLMRGDQEIAWLSVWVAHQGFVPPGDVFPVRG